MEYDDGRGREETPDQRRQIADDQDRTENADRDTDPVAYGRQSGRERRPHGTVDENLHRQRTQRLMIAIVGH